MEVRNRIGVCPIGLDTREMARLALLQPGRRALDLGTGTGYVAIELASAGWLVDAVDVNPRAVATARANAMRAGVEIHPTFSNLYSAVTGRYELIVCNPPASCRETVVSRILTSVLRRCALVAGLLLRLRFWLLPTARLDFLSRVVAGAEEHLEPGGRLILFISAREEAYLLRKFPAFRPLEVHRIPILHPLVVTIWEYQA